MDVKQCTKWGKIKPLDQYSKGSVYAGGRRTWCKQCDNEHHAELYQKRKNGVQVTPKKRARKKPKPEAYADYILGQIDLDEFELPADDY